MFSCFNLKQMIKKKQKLDICIGTLVIRSKLCFRHVIGVHNLTVQTIPHIGYWETADTFTLKWFQQREYTCNRISIQHQVNKFRCFLINFLFFYFFGNAFMLWLKHLKHCSHMQEIFRIMSLVDLVMVTHEMELTRLLTFSF